MTKLRKILLALFVLLVVLAGFGYWATRGDVADLPIEQVTGDDPTLAEPDEETIPTVAIAEPVGWAAGEAPTPAAGLEVKRFADGLDHPRVLHRLPNGDVLVTLTRAPAGKPGDEGLFDKVRGWIEGMLMARAGAKGPSPDQLVLLRDADKDGVAETRKVLRDDLASPSGIAWRDGTLYVANHDALLAFAYELGADTVAGAPRKLMDLPAGGGHWMRNIELNPDGSKLYIAVGSVSNVGEQGMEVEEGRAMIWELDTASNRPRPYAVGLRNPNGLDFNPLSGELWTTVNERDMLGSDLVPDYLTNVPVGAQYGWPWLYWGDNLDGRVKAPRPPFIVEYTRRPEYALGPHVAALGLVFSAEGNLMGDRFGRGAFIARHGSWNRKPPSGYDVIYVAFDERGNPLGKPVPVLTGFLKGDGTTRGRPTWVEWGGDGSLLVSDDTAGIIWRVVATGAAPAAALERVRGTSMRPRVSLDGAPTASFNEDYARESN
ncbi:sorbosone dehydrogenase family protein [Parerythrobacter aurantius]|uniref:PQQ-dependent sugar dehydrogenase n=1 Tax=Parerythrobacter aurantius TaxID=3127706 RepID=UPI0032542692